MEVELKTIGVPSITFDTETKTYKCVTTVVVDGKEWYLEIEGGNNE